MPVVLSTLLFTLLYSAVPNRKVPIKHALTGAVVVALLVETAKAGFALFITLSPSYQVIYGAFAAVPLFLLWIYLSWIMVLLGAVIVRSIDVFSDQQKGEKLPPMVAMLVVLNALQRAFRIGRGTSFSLLEHDDWRFALQDWQLCTSRLMGMDIAGKNDQGEYILIKDLRDINLTEFCDQLPWPLPLDEELQALKPDTRSEWFQNLCQRLYNLNR